ncbi:AraC-like ligand binding domain-containing protein [Evansella caseinilytica]|uniref:AraC-like ligand binding domain-containing protein n=1 Tax=Evansella caseinilytica TaxID=1503961 RepID=A0A1H3TLY7_9BACI|nr:AraC-like ligand binding domain-containing protein [Evansella caseinilytica]
MLTPYNEKELPLFAESVGFNPNQEKLIRPDGYSYFHWIQTVHGEGEIIYHDKSLLLPKNSGVLLSPHVPHVYKATSKTKQWQTYYFTFGGEMASFLIAKLSMQPSAFYQWEETTPLSRLVERILQRAETAEDIFGINASTDVYYFLMTLKRYGKLQEKTAVSSNITKLQPLIQWMEAHIGNPDVGLDEMAEVLHVSKRHLNSLFRETFDVSPYVYFLNLRMRKAKQLLIEEDDVAVKDIAARVGFLSSSHFVATFRKYVGVPPEQFRRLH